MRRCVQGIRPARTGLVRLPATPQRPSTAAAAHAMQRCAASAASAGYLPPPGEATRRVDALFRRSAPLLTLERAVGEKHGIDGNLWDSCRFGAQIYPDLPLASTWRDLLRRTVQTAGRAAEPGSVDPPPAACPAERWTVRTVAAQLRSRDQLRSMMLSAAGVGLDGEPRPGAAPADALLFVSGSHPARRLPGAGRRVWFWCWVCRWVFWWWMVAAAGQGIPCSLPVVAPAMPAALPQGSTCTPGVVAPLLLLPTKSTRLPAPLHCSLCRWLQTSFDLLLLASAMREEGYLPASLSLWAVENPMLAPVDRLQQKADAGAEVVLTQPPLLWDRTAAWAEQAAAQRVSEHVKVGGRGGRVRDGRCSGMLERVLPAA